jgi:hypothetical protein
MEQWGLEGAGPGGPGIHGASGRQVRDPGQGQAGARVRRPGGEGGGEARAQCSPSPTRRAARPGAATVTVTCGTGRPSLPRRSRARPGDGDEGGGEEQPKFSSPLPPAGGPGPTLRAPQSRIRLFNFVLKSHFKRARRFVLIQLQLKYFFERRFVRTFDLLSVVKSHFAPSLPVGSETRGISTL